MKAAASLSLLLVGAGIGTAGCQIMSSVAFETDPTVSASPAMVSGPAPSVTPVTPLTPVDRYRLSFRLKPDARFVAAAAEIHHLLTGEPAESCRLLLRDDLWLVEYRGEPVALLPELADYGEAMEALAGWASRWAARGPRPEEFVDESRLESIRSAVGKLSPPNLWRALGEIDPQWDPQRPDPRLVEEAGRALTWLAVQSRDDLQISDRLAAKALAALALVRAYRDPSTLTAEEALLADRLEYRREASRLAEGLDPAHPVRLFLRGESQELRKTTRRSRSDPQRRLLSLLDLARRGAADEWAARAEELARDPDWNLAVVASAFELKGYWYQSRVAEFALENVLLESARQSGEPGLLDRLGASSSGRLDALVEEAGSLERVLFQIPALHPLASLERHLGAVAIEPGPFLDREVFESYFRGLLYSGLYRLASHYLHSLGSVQRGRQLLELIGSAPNGIGQDFRSWLKDQVEALDGTRTPDGLWGGLARFQSLGHPLRFQTYLRLAESSPYGDPMILQGARLLAARMDSRIGHRRDLAHLGRHHLRDLGLAERLLLSVQETDPSSDWVGPWHAYFTADTEQLRRLAETVQESPETREAAITLGLREGVISVSDAHALHWQLIDSEPHQWPRYRAAIRNLEDGQAYSAALEVARAWLRKNGDDDYFPFLFARTAAARMLQQLGRPDEALELVYPLVESWQAGVLNRTALILAELGRFGEAEQTARALSARYPQLAFAHGCLAQVLWTAGKNQPAAELLRRAVRFPSDAWRESFGKPFAEVFRGRPEEAQEAFGTLMRLGIAPWLLEQLIVPVDRQGDHQLAFQLQSMLKPSAEVGSLSLPVRAFVYLEQAQNRKAAVEWLRQALPENRVNPAGMWMFREQQYGLLWDLIPRPEDGECGECVWMLRAAAVLVDEQAAARRPEVEARLQAGGQGIYWDIGRYLLGMLDEQALLAHSEGSREECEIAYFIGFKAMAEGRLRDASDWFHVAELTGQQQTLEYRLALDQLYRWWSEGKRLGSHRNTEKAD